MSGGGEVSRVAGVQAVVGTGRIELGRDSNGGSGGRKDGGGGGGGGQGDKNLIKRV